jgi:hypothetical protein
VGGRTSAFAPERQKLRKAATTVKKVKRKEIVKEEDDFEEVEKLATRRTKRVKKETAVKVEDDFEEDEKPTTRRTKRVKKETTIKVEEKTPKPTTRGRRTHT